MRDVNVEMVREWAREIRESLDKIRAYAAQPDADFFADERNLYTVMHLLLICIEAVAGVCNHLLAKTARRSPASYGECFEGLREAGIIDDTLAGRLIQMARFRNILVHRYWQVQPERVLRYARENLGDFEAFLRSVGQFVGGKYEQTTSTVILTRGQDVLVGCADRICYLPFTRCSRRAGPDLHLS